MKFFKFFIIFLILQSFSIKLYAENNVAFIDMQLIMDKSLAGQSLKKQLENLHKKNLESFKKKEDILKKKGTRCIGKKKFTIQGRVSKRNIKSKN
tara:strand:- start:679 stop:963 length:285 start_codon:yes stop_codon:yes gene_type:complete